MEATIEETIERKIATEYVAEEKSVKEVVKTTTEKKPLLIGLDLGTNRSCLQAAYRDSRSITTNRIIPSVVGYAKDGIVNHVLPNNIKVMFGDDAIRNRLHLELVWPLKKGVVVNVPAARDYAKYLRSVVCSNGAETRAVIGVPAEADNKAREYVRQALTGVFDRILLIPESFLAALGYRDEEKLGTPGYKDPARNSLFVDIGAGTTDICLIQGYFPTSEDQICIPFAGDAIDDLLYASIRRTYPDCNLSIIRVREIKEKYSYVGKYDGTMEVEVVVGGKMRVLDLTTHICEACGELVKLILEGIQIIISRADPDSVTELLQNIVLAGGGSQIGNIAPELERLLRNEGFANPGVRTVGENYEEYVAKGALRTAMEAREHQWQYLIA
jgi:rod shape-determining protein MreB